jgi:hypothetical protein
MGRRGLVVVAWAAFVAADLGIGQRGGGCGGGWDRDGDATHSADMTRFVCRAPGGYQVFRVVPASSPDLAAASTLAHPLPS